MAAFLPRLKVKPELILSSPLPRAWQTAEIVAEHWATELREEAALGQSFGAAQLRKLVDRNDHEELMIVGHEPDFSALVRALTGGNVKLAKGGIARIDLEEGALTGRLIWLIPPKAAN